ncbi:hypothetical protein CFBP4215_02851 [Pseudomonas syringae pv. syringae]|nr:hypothetical protein CFBP4215_02851 [Pseudomonas syringae pv. syringae]
MRQILIDAIRDIISGLLTEWLIRFADWTFQMPLV